uniref:SAC domain-containing protein n=1 Tax=Ananas comosus var. bracteatus TaxID=296719 RepID=A0A6V7NHS9_ANACO|nr:unnamed protein product [Ananas comosus var. bracteatus]
MAKARELEALATVVAKPPSPDPDIDPSKCSLEKFRLYETRARFYLVGSDREKRFFRVLKIDRSEPYELNLSEDPVVYTPQEVNNLLQRISEGNRSTGGLNFVAKVYGIAGCIKFLESYYLILVTKRRQIGAICGHAIYCIDESQMITVPHSSIQSDVAHSKSEIRYKKLLSSVDLTKDFYYSYTYPIMQSLQKNVLSSGKEKMPYDNLFVWNEFLTRPIRSRCSNTLWTIALVHGHFKQAKLSIFWREFTVALISRRSRHFAGTRYLKRGVNDLGRVANDVETEQLILDEEAGLRGEASRFSPKPDIILQRYDPTYQATKLHFEDLVQRYGNPIIVLNLIKTVEKRPREMMLRREFANAVGYLNQILPEEKQLKFIHWDFHKFAKSKSANVLAVLGGVASQALDLTGFYCSGKPKNEKNKSNQLSRTSTGREASSGDLSRLSSNIETFKPTSAQERRKELNQQRSVENEARFQSGVLRTNCIDCLDRTNVAQYAYGLAALGRQLHAMGLSDVPKVDSNSSIAEALMEMYQSMGTHSLSNMEALLHIIRQGKWKATTQSREFLKSIKRYYSNAYTDGEKQDAINLFLGYFQPQDGKPALWELDTDYYLHVNGLGDEMALDNYNDKSSSLGTPPNEAPGLIRNVRIYSESDARSSGSIGNPGMAPDAAEIQLKTPNWLFGQRKYEESAPATKVPLPENVNGGLNRESSASGYGDLNWLSYAGDSSEEDIFRRYLATASLDETDDWYGGTLIYDQDENSEVYKHYAELCQGPVMDPFEHDSEKEKHYAEALYVGLDSADYDARVEAEMEAALKEYEIIGSDLGIVPSCKALAEDPTRLTRWIIGEEKVQLYGK